MRSEEKENVLLIQIQQYKSTCYFKMFFVLDSKITFAENHVIIDKWENSFFILTGIIPY